MLSIHASLKACERRDLEGVQTLVVKCDQEVSVVDVKNPPMREVRGVEGLTVMPEEAPVGASAANDVIERECERCRALRERLLCEPGSAILTWAVEFSRKVVSRFERSVSDGKTASRKSNRKALAPFGEMVMEKPMDKDEVRNHVGSCGQI